MGKFKTFCSQFFFIFLQRIYLKSTKRLYGRRKDSTTRNKLF